VTDCADGGRKRRVWDDERIKQPKVNGDSDAGLYGAKRLSEGGGESGQLTVDEGATAAILERGSSLLPKGIKNVTGNFSRGEVIRNVSTFWRRREIPPQFRQNIGVFHRCRFK
jgi:hypothetical protein